MIAATGLRWILTTLFTVTTAFSLYRAIRPGPAPAESTLPARLNLALHAVMGAAMLAMLWPWGTTLPVVPQVVLFALAAAWFLLAAVLPTGTLRVSVGGGHPRLHSTLHAVMMGATAWMLAVMSPPHMPTGRSGDGMPGMTTGDSGSTMSVSLHGAPHTVAGLLSAFFVLTALWWLTRTFDTARRTGLTAPSDEPYGFAGSRMALDAGCHGGMALGMAVMLLMMT